jgi:hypothetical protein
MNTFVVWLCAMAVALSLLSLFLAIMVITSGYTELKRAGAPKPGLILWKRILCNFFGGRKKTDSVAIPPLETDRLKDTPVWLSWDIRWVSSGTGLGRIVEVIQSPTRLELVIELPKPTRFVPDEEGLSEVVFEPRNPIALIRRSRFSSIHGVLKTPDESEKINTRGAITCELVTLSNP